jgi:hypothetical protein
VGEGGEKEAIYISLKKKANVCFAQMESIDSRKV